MDHHPTEALALKVLAGANPDVKIIKLGGQLSIHNFFDFQELTRQKPYPKVLLVDLTEVLYIDSAALGSFVGLHVSCEENGRKYALVGANARLQNLFDLTQVRAFLVAFDTLAEAESALA